MKTEIIFLYNNHRCHAEVVEKLSVEKTWKTFVGRVDGYEIYRTCGVHFNQFGFEAIKKQEDADMTNLINELLNEGFTKEQVEEIIAMVVCGESIDSAIQSLFI